MEYAKTLLMFLEKNFQHFMHVSNMSKKIVHFLCQLFYSVSAIECFVLTENFPFVAGNGKTL